MGHNAFAVGTDNLCIGYSSLGPLLTFRAANLSLGIGNTLPSYKLDVSGDSRVSGTFNVDTSNIPVHPL